MTTTTSSATTSSDTRSASTLSGIGVGRGSAVGSVVKLAAAARPPANEPPEGPLDHHRAARSWDTGSCC